MTELSPQSGYARRPRLSRWAGWLLVLGLVFAALGLIWQALSGTALSTDLDRIGQGVPAVVVIHEDANATSTEVMERLHELERAELGRIEFLVADQDRTPGQELAARHDAQQAGTLLLFGPQGELQETLAPPESTGELLKSLHALSDR